MWMTKAFPELLFNDINVLNTGIVLAVGTWAMDATQQTSQMVRSFCL